MTAVAGVAEYLAHVLAELKPLRPLPMALLDAHGQVLADDVAAPAAVPAFDVAAVDGYAVRAADLAGASVDDPTRLAVVGDLRAASWQPVRVSAGACYGVAAGTPLPAAADAVIPVGWTDGGVAAVRVTRAPAPGHGVHATGELVDAGAVLAEAGSRVGPGQVALFAAAGVGTVAVRPSPRVSVVATGDELVDAGRVSAPGRVVDADSYAITAAAREAGAQATRLGVVPDEDEALRALIEDQAHRADLLVVTGGSGAGPGDVARRLFGVDGAVEYVSLPLHPAAVLGFGRVGPYGVPIACLPGETGAALLGFEVLVRPVVRRLAGAEPFRPSVKARLTERLSSPRDVREFRPARVTERRGGGYTVHPLPGGDALLTGYAAANGLLVLGERVADLPAGSTVDVLLFDRSR